jgi:hypothetical protein
MCCDVARSIYTVSATVCTTGTKSPARCGNHCVGAGGRRRLRFRLRAKEVCFSPGCAGKKCNRYAEGSIATRGSGCCPIVRAPTMMASTRPAMTPFTLGPGVAPTAHTIGRLSNPLSVFGPSCYAYASTSGLRDLGVLDPVWPSRPATTGAHSLPRRFGSLGVCATCLLAGDVDANRRLFPSGDGMGYTGRWGAVDAGILRSRVAYAARVTYT